MSTAKVLKTPPLGPATKLLAFDLESNGLHGEVFAAGAAVMDVSGKVLDEFSARCPIDSLVDEWVQSNVLPAIADMPLTHKSYKDLQEAFWTWYLTAEPQVDYVLVSNGYPVEYRFLLKCQEEDLETRYWQHPFPILDLTSILLTVGQDASSKSRLIAEVVGAGRFKRHHPLDDAKIAALVAIKALGLSYAGNSSPNKV